MVTRKIWGLTEVLIQTSMFEMHRLQILPHMRCSLHSHKFKHNAFYILSGTLIVDSVVSDVTGVPVEAAQLRAGSHFTVAPGVWHQFRTDQENCEALEMYYTEPLSEDIIRRNTGGPV